MRFIHLLIILVFINLQGCRRHQQANLDHFVLLQNIDVIDGTGTAAKSRQDILIKNSRIVQIGDTERLKIPKNTTIINYSGKFLIPGLIDLHVHFPSDENTQKLMLRQLLEYGITTLLNPGARPNAGVTLRNKIINGELPGPTMFTAGRIIENNKTDKATISWASKISNKQMLVHAIETQAERNVDFIKLYESMTPELVMTAIKTAKQHNIQIVGHMGKTTWKQAAEMGIDMLVHSGWGTPMDEIVNLENPDSATDTEWYRAYADATNGNKFSALVKSLIDHEVVVVPTVSIHQASGLGHDASLLPLFKTELAPDARLPGWWGEGWQHRHPQYGADSDEEAHMMATVYFPAILNILKAYHDSGVKLAVGTDVGNAWMTPGYVFHHELKLYQDAGIPPLSILKMATYNGAEALGMLHEIGSVTVGKKADLIVLNQNPSIDIRNTQTIEAIFLAGELITTHLQ